MVSSSHVRLLRYSYENRHEKHDWETLLITGDWVEAHTVAELYIKHSKNNSLIKYDVVYSEVHENRQGATKYFKINKLIRLDRKRINLKFWVLFYSALIEHVHKERGKSMKELEQLNGNIDEQYKDRLSKELDRIVKLFDGKDKSSKQELWNKKRKLDLLLEIHELEDAIIRTKVEIDQKRRLVKSIGKV